MTNNLMIYSFLFVFVIVGLYLLFNRLRKESFSIDDNSEDFAALMESDDFEEPSQDDFFCLFLNDGTCRSGYLSKDNHSSNT